MLTNIGLGSFMALATCAIIGAVWLGSRFFPALGRLFDWFSRLYVLAYEVECLRKGKKDTGERLDCLHDTMQKRAAEIEERFNNRSIHSEKRLDKIEDCLGRAIAEEPAGTMVNRSGLGLPPQGFPAIEKADRWIEEQFNTVSRMFKSTVNVASVDISRAQFCTLLLDAIEYGRANPEKRKQ